MRDDEPKDKRTNEWKRWNERQKNDGPSTLRAPGNVPMLAAGILVQASEEDMASLDAITLVKLLAVCAKELDMRASRKGNIEADV